MEYIETELTNQEFENITSHLLDKTGVLCQDVLDELHYTWNDITDILLVGRLYKNASSI